MISFKLYSSSGELVGKTKMNEIGLNSDKLFPTPLPCLTKKPTIYTAVCGFKFYKKAFYYKFWIFNTQQKATFCNYRVTRPFTILSCMFLLSDVFFYLKTILKKHGQKGPLPCTGLVNLTKFQHELIGFNRKKSEVFHKPIIFIYEMAQLKQISSCWNLNLQGLQDRYMAKVLPGSAFPK